MQSAVDRHLASLGVLPPTGTLQGISMQYVEFVRYVRDVQYVLHSLYSMYNMYLVSCTKYTKYIHKYNTLTNIGHRFGHQNRLYESPGRYSTIFRNGFAFHVYPVLSKMCIIVTCQQICRFLQANWHVWTKCRVLFHKKQLTVSLLSRKHVWGYQCM